MASSVTVEVHGKRTSVQAKPMKPVQDIIHAALEASKLTHLDASACTLQYNGKQLDLTTPFRFANIPTGAKLTLITGHEPTRGIVDDDDAPGTSKAAAVGGSTQAAVPPVDDTPSTAAATTPDATESTACKTTAPIQDGGAAGGAGHNTAPTAAAPTAAPTATTDNAPPPDNTSSPPPLYIFHRHDLEAQPSSTYQQQASESDDFFTFTEADYHVVMAGYASRAKQQSQHLKTSAMRAAEEASRAASFSHVPVRVQLPDGYIMQSEFKGSDALAVVRARLQPLLKHTSWYLYTTPPKTKLTDEQPSLYALRLVPAALLYVGCDGASGVENMWVTDQALEAHKGLPPRADAGEEKEGRGGSKQSNGKGGVDSDPWVPYQPAVEQLRREGEGGGRKVPKWMKL